MSSCDVAVLGAGPYGLAATASLRERGNAGVRVFGEPMSSWAAMPAGMLLRSPYEATHIAGRRSPLSLTHFLATQGSEPSHPVALETFIAYGRWFASQVAPDVDERRIERIARNGKGFAVSLAGGEVVEARRVVVAAGISTFAWRPPVFGDLPASHASHTSEHTDLGAFRGRSVLVIGGGQSALESAALLAEGGAEVEVVVREAVVHWLARRWQHRLGPITRLLYAPPDVGPAGVSWLVATPGTFRRLPREMQQRLGTRSIRPAGAGWLVSRVAGIPIRTGVSAVGAELTGDGRAEVSFDDGSVRTSRPRPAGNRLPGRHRQIPLPRRGPPACRRDGRRLPGAGPRLSDLGGGAACPRRACRLELRAPDALRRRCGVCGAARDAERP